MKVILFMAMSLNGKIANHDFTEDFISERNWDELVRLSKKTGCLIWGRKTYDVVRSWEKKYFEPLKKVSKIVLTSQESFKTSEGFVALSSPHKILDFLKKKGYKRVILNGGSKDNTSFAKLGLIDEVVIDIDPVIVGEGIPLFFPEDLHIDLKLVRTKSIDKRIVQLVYKVVK